MHWLQPAVVKRVRTSINLVLWVTLLLILDPLLVQNSGAAGIRLTDVEKEQLIAFLTTLRIVPTSPGSSSLNHDFYSLKKNIT